MEGRIGKLDYYSKAIPENGVYTEKIKKDIANAAFAALTPQLRAKKIEDMNQADGWEPKNIQALCLAMLETEHILSLLPQIEEKRKLSLERQISHQNEGLSNPQNKLAKFPHINRHTLVNELYKYSSDLENKFQISFMPYPEDEAGLPENEESSPEYFAIKQVHSEEEGSQYNPYPKIVEYSVYDIKKIPVELIDFALHGNAKPKYNGEEEGQLLMEGADNIEKIKQCLINARPLLYEPTESSDIADYTQRIMRLEHNGKKLYMLSENTPQVYQEKSRRSYTNTNIRYTFFTDKEKLIIHLGYQLPAAANKITHFEELKQFLPATKESLQNIYKDERLFTNFMEGMGEFKNQTLGLTKLEQLLREYIKGLSYKNASADRMIFQAMHKKIGEGKLAQEKMVEYMQRHIESLQDPGF